MKKEITQLQYPKYIYPPKNVNPYQWNLLYLHYLNAFMEEASLNRIHLDDENAIQELTQSNLQILRSDPIIQIDSMLNNLIEDTQSNFYELHSPYPAFFINKEFKTTEGRIIGIYVVDPNQFNIPFVNKWGLRFSFVYIKEDLIWNIKASQLEIINHKEKYNKKENIIVKQALIYAANVINLINTHVDINNPTNPEKDIRIIPLKNSSKKNRKRKNEAPEENNVSIIRVFGDLKQYTEDYNKEKRKAGKKNTKSFIVRGHWKQFRSDRYTNMKGKTIWIYPYIKGMSKELYQKIVHVKP